MRFILGAFEGFISLGWEPLYLFVQCLLKSIVPVYLKEII